MTPPPTYFGSIVDLVSIDPISHKYAVIPRDASARCILPMAHISGGTIQQIVSDRYNISTTDGYFAWDGTNSEFVPGYLPLDMLSFTWDAEKLVMTIKDANDQAIGQIIGDPSRDLSIPITGNVSLNFEVTNTTDMTVISLTYTATFALSPFNDGDMSVCALKKPYAGGDPAATWGDVAKLETFPMQVQVVAPIVLYFDGQKIISTYSFVADPIDTMTGASSNAVPFTSGKPVHIHLLTQCQNAENIF